ncbi:hypothetical protein [Thalassotalea piscium]|uniref:DUF3857 domain-containing protein n=1 Tax=Thalassotalea piscium TaxID=1230533 RepID=A0A7X0TUG2_9GAMM|nr:hypothetical protein [Thalassotalea piscium]MBB6544168.1 hypothetical protein [Thalassotalea piscium]
MFRVCIVLLFSLLSVLVAAQEQALPPLESKYEASHAMVLFTHNSIVYAYNLPQYNLPSNVQVLYKLEVKDVALLQLVRDAQIVTIKPEVFNIQRLMQGEELTINADIYMGHFERDGMLVHEKRPLTFAKKLYARYMADLQASSKKQIYDVVPLNKNNKIYIHQIQQPPSYDHVIHIDIEASCLSTFNTSSPVPKRSELQYKFINCGTMKPLYYETKDFQ